jgi:hypothetical protein
VGILDFGFWILDFGFTYGASRESKTCTIYSHTLPKALRSHKRKQQAASFANDIACVQNPKSKIQNLH